MSRIGMVVTRVFARTPLADLAIRAHRGGGSLVPPPDESRELLASISPRPVDPWPITSVAERDPEIGLSIIVPVYNEGHYVGDCLESICNSKTSVRFEVVVVDDGSTDDSGAICDEWATRDTRIRVIHQKNRGFSGARNAGIDAARGGVLMFVDSDDMISNTLIEALFSELERSGVDVVSGGFTKMAEGGNLGRKLGVTKSRHGGPWSRVYRRANKWEFRFPEGYWFEDTIITYMILQQRSCVWIDDCGYLRRYHPLQISATHKVSPKALDSYWIVECVLDRMRELGMQFGQDAYDQTLRQFGPLLISRIGGVLDEDGMRALFSCCCDLLARTEEFDGFSTTIVGRWSDIETALRSRNYELWRAACKYA